MQRPFEDHNGSIANKIASRDDAMHIAESMLPHSERPLTFFIQAVWSILTETIWCLQLLRPQKWRLDDLVHLSRDLDLLVETLQTTSEGQQMASHYLYNCHPDTQASIMAALSACLTRPPFLKDSCEQGFCIQCPPLAQHVCPRQGARMRHRIPKSELPKFDKSELPKFDKVRKLRGTTYRLVQPLGPQVEVDPDANGLPAPQHYKAFQSNRGHRDRLCVFHELDRGKASLQHIGVLEAVVENDLSFPRILDYGQCGSSICVVTEWMRGHTLREHLDGAVGAGNDGAKAISLDQAVGLFRKFAGTLYRLHHKHNLVHGDLKPANLVVRRRPNWLVMIDFGEAWQAERTARRNIQERMMLDYVAPELQQEGGFVDFRADIFSASVIFFEMLTLELPYGRSGGKVAQFSPAYADTYLPPSKVCRHGQSLTKDIWNNIDRVVTKGLQLDPAKRYQSGADWLKDVQTISTRTGVRQPQKPVRQSPEGKLARFLSWLRRLGN